MEKGIRPAILAIKDRLGRYKIPWVIFAGAAAHCYGSKRTVTDIDILVKETDLKRAKAILSDLEKVDVAGDLTIETTEGICRFYMDDEMIERIKLKQFLDVNVPVIPVEDNIVFKAILQRGESEGKHDIEDIKEMLSNVKVDSAYLERRIIKCGAGQSVYPLMRKLEIIP